MTFLREWAEAPAYPTLRQSLHDHRGDIVDLSRAAGEAHDDIVNARDDLRGGQVPSGANGFLQPRYAEVLVLRVLPLEEAVGQQHEDVTGGQADLLCRSIGHRRN